MDLEDAWGDTTVAAAVAGSTIIVTVLLEYVLAVESSPLLRVSPLSIYLIYLFTHERLPEGLDQPRNWMALAVLAGIAVLFVALQTGG